MSENIDTLVQRVEKTIPELLQEASRKVLPHPKQLHDTILSPPLAESVKIEADVEMDRRLRAGLEPQFRAISFLTEELSPTSAEDSEWVWVIDPIDGTHNCLNGYPQYAHSIALKHYGVTVYGCIYDPNRRELFDVTRGRGVRINGRTVKQATEGPPALRLFAAGRGSDRRGADVMMEVLRLIQHSFLGIRMAGCASLDMAHVALGRIDCFAHPSLKIWDAAAAELMVTEMELSVAEVPQLRGKTTRCLIVGTHATESMVSEAFSSVLQHEGHLEKGQKS